MINKIFLVIMAFISISMCGCNKNKIPNKISLDKDIIENDQIQKNMDLLNQNGNNIIGEMAIVFFEDDEAILDNEYNGLFINLFDGIEDMPEKYLYIENYEIIENKLYNERGDPDKSISVINDSITITYDYYGTKIKRSVSIKNRNTENKFGKYIDRIYTEILDEYGKPNFHYHYGSMEYINKDQNLWVVFRYDNWRINLIYFGDYNYFW